jgi:hypothetical protein
VFVLDEKCGPPQCQKIVSAVDLVLTPSGNIAVGKRTRLGTGLFRPSAAYFDFLGPTLTFSSLKRTPLTFTIHPVLKSQLASSLSGAQRSLHPPFAKYGTTTKISAAINTRLRPMEGGEHTAHHFAISLNIVIAARWFAK